MKYVLPAIAGSSMLAFIPAAQAATLCVNPTGKGGCETTIQAAVDAAAAGDTIKIKSGTYFESVDVPASKTGLTIKGSGGVIIDPENVNDGTIDALDIDADDVTVMKLNIHNASIGIDVGADNVRISNVYIRNTSSDCIEVDGNGAVIEKNTLRACGSDGIDLDGDDAVIARNNISQISDNGIDVDPGNNALIEKNNLLQTENNGIDVEGDDARVERNRIVQADSDGIEVSGANPQILRNQVSLFADDGVEVDCNDVGASCTTALIEGNKIKDGVGDSSDYCVEFDGDTDGAVIHKNLGLRCSADGFNIDGEGAVTVTNNRSINAGFNGSDDGFAIDGLGKKTLKNNQARGSSDDGFDIEDGDEDPGVDAEHELENNKAIDNSSDGIDVDESADGTVLTGNKVKKNVRNGIALFSDDNVLTGNKSKKNRVGFDFCDEGTGTTTSGDKFGSESTDCAPPAP